MKKALAVLCLLALFGCASGQNYLDEPEWFIKDPHFADYKNQRDDLEVQYLHKEITYAEYVEQKSKLDEKYDREVQERNSKVMPSSQM